MQDIGAEELMMAMELEMEARNPSGAAFQQQPQSALGRRLAWVLSFAVPGLGMFTEGGGAASGSGAAAVQARGPELRISRGTGSLWDLIAFMSVTAGVLCSLLRLLSGQSHPRVRGGVPTVLAHQRDVLQSAAVVHSLHTGDLLG